MIADFFEVMQHVDKNQARGHSAFTRVEASDVIVAQPLLKIVDGIFQLMGFVVDTDIFFFQGPDNPGQEVFKETLWPHLHQISSAHFNKVNRSVCSSSDGAVVGICPRNTSPGA